ncbi:MAG: FAD-dependent oxidoreductase, partial [Candidatus Omnitrophica bacterium]|nr:FAD-dependent oxidoreductase [Candidatus Omnitrophota bacterium]
MSCPITTLDRPVRVAVIGSGPSGFYATEALFAKTNDVSVDMFERLPAPFGLVRYGVSPDHLKIKNVIKVYEKIAEHKNFSYFGNVTVGKDVSVSELRKFYDAIIFTCGAESDRRLGIPGENLLGSHTATEFVGWYNGHPNFLNHKFDLSHEVGVIIGQGNVALDVARILAKTADELKNTDIAQYALEVLAESKVREIHLIGRRGPAQAAFTPVEIRELGHLNDGDPILDPQELILNEASQQEINDPQHAQRKKNFEILQQFTALPNLNKRRKVLIRFLRSPLEIQGKNHVEKVVLEKNQLVGTAHHQKAQGTGVKEEIACGIVFQSVGYYGTPIPEVPFDFQKGIFPNQA